MTGKKTESAPIAIPRKETLADDTLEFLDAIGRPPSVPQFLAMFKQAPQQGSGLSQSLNTRSAPTPLGKPIKI